MQFVWRGLILRWENYQIKKIGPRLRSVGQTMLKFGQSLQGDYLNDDKCNLFYIF